ncbi:MAG: carbohydrate ABC transporter permease [Caldilineaceae bacterium]
MAQTQAQPYPNVPTSAWTAARLSKWSRQVLLYGVLLTGGIAFALPFLWMVSSSLKGQTEVFLFPPRPMPKVVRWENYPDALTAVPFGRYFLNSLLVSSMVVIGTVLSSSLVGYGFARIKGWGREALFAIVLATMMLPNQVTMIPTFLIFRSLDWINTLYPLTVPFFFGSAFNIFLYRQFFRGISSETSDAAKIDGCNHLGIYWWIIMPMSRAVTATVAILALFWSWNEFLLPLIYLNSQKLYTVPLGLAMFQQFYDVQTPWHWLMAASVVAVAPLIIVFFFTQRLLLQGIVITGVK